MLRIMTLILRSIESEIEPDLKTVILLIAQIALQILKKNPNDYLVRETILLLFNKLVIVMGIDLMPFAKDLFTVIAFNKDMVTLSSLIKLSTLIVHSWKKKGIELAKDILGFLLSIVQEIGFPASNVSDIEKMHLDIIHSYLKFMRVIIREDLMVLFQQKVDQFSIFFDFLVKCSQLDLNELIKKQAILLIGMTVAGSLGLNLSSENLGVIINTQPSKTSQIPAVFPEFTMMIRIMMQCANESAFLCLDHINTKNQDDLQILNEISALHCLMYRAYKMEFIKKLGEWLNIKSWAKYQGNFAEWLEIMHTKKSTKEYKENLKVLLCQQIQ